MSEVNVLNEVKTRLGITGTYQDNLLTAHINDVKDFLLDSGIPSDVIASTASLGVISRGVSDLWNYGAGDGEFSKVFFQRAKQLTLKEVDENG